MTNVLSIEQIAQVAVNAGLASGSQTLFTCVAIALGESGGDFDTNNAGLNTDGTVDYGGWQINSIHNPPVPDIYTPSVNAQYMMKISSNGTNWTPWVAYNNGSYLTHLGKVMGELSGKQLVPGPDSDSGTAGGGTGATFQTVGVTDIVGNTSNIVDFFKKLADPDTWVQILKVVLGLTLILSAALNLALHTKAGKASVDAALLVATKGKGKMAKTASTAAVAKDVAK